MRADDLSAATAPDRMVRLDHLDSPWKVAGIVALAFALFLVVRLARHDGDPSYFVTAGSSFCDPAAAPANLSIIPDSAGYDGQFYYRLALDPAAAEQSKFGVSLDNPPYRHQRILYPSLVWCLSLGRSASVPAAMILVNYLALCALGWLAGAYAQCLGRHALWGLLLAFYPGLILTLARDLVEILEVTLLLGGMLSLRRGKFAAAAALLTGAVLTKETALLFVAAGLAIWLVQTIRKQGQCRGRLLALVIPALIWIAWQIVLWSHWGHLPVLAGGRNLGPPGDGLVRFLGGLLSLDHRARWLWAGEAGYVALCVLGAGCGLRRSSATAHEKLAWVLYGAMALCFSGDIWAEDWAFLRALSDFCLLGGVIVIGSNTRLRMPVVAAWMGTWLTLFALRVR